MLRFRPLLALSLLVVLTGGSAVQHVHRVLHAAEAAAERTEHVAGHHADHDHTVPHAEAPCAPALAEPDCAVCALTLGAPRAAREAAPPGGEVAPRLAAQAVALRLAAASSGARGPPQV